MSEKYCVVCRETKIDNFTERKGQFMCSSCAERYDELKQKHVDTALKELLEMEE